MSLMIDVYSCSDGLRFLSGVYGRKLLLIVGLHPPLEAQERDEFAVERLWAETQASGHDGFVQANLCPLRVATREALPQKIDPVVFERNLEEIEQLVRQNPGLTVGATWGPDAEQRGYLVRARDDLYRRLAPYSPSWVRLDEATAAATPGHTHWADHGWRLVPYEPAG